MSFQPVVPSGGFAGWQFLKRTIDTQRAAFDASPSRQRDVEYFRERISEIGSAQELVADRRLRSVALGAFGLDADIDNRFFIQKVLEEGTTSRDALSNKLADKRYRAFSEAFGFGNGALPNTAQTGFGERIVQAYLERQFEIGVGESNQSTRLALTLERELPGLSARAVSNDTKWLTVMGNPPLRKVFEVALGLPESFGALDLDRQLEEFKSRSARVLGTSDLARLAQREELDEVLRTYLARSQLNETPGAAFTSSSAALTLLSAAASP